MTYQRWALELNSSAANRRKGQRVKIVWIHCLTILNSHSSFKRNLSFPVAREFWKKSNGFGTWVSTVNSVGNLPSYWGSFSCARFWTDWQTPAEADGWREVQNHCWQHCRASNLSSLLFQFKNWYFDCSLPSEDGYVPSKQDAPAASINY